MAQPLYTFGGGLFGSLRSIKKRRKRKYSSIL